MSARSILFVTLLVGCSSHEEPAADYCTRHCEALSRCGVDVDICVRGCQKTGPNFGSNVRADYVEAILACERTAPCSDALSCRETAKASITPSAAARAYCSEWVKKNPSCNPTSPAPTVEACAESQKELSDSAFEGMMGCLAKDCGEWGACEYPYRKW